MGEINSFEGFKGCQADPLPVEQVLRHGQGDPGAVRRERRVRHDIMLEWIHKGNARILASTAAIRSPLVIGFWLQRDAKPLNTDRFPTRIELDSCNADAREVTLGDDPWKQVQLTIRAPNGSRIQHAFCLQGVAGFRFHQYPEAR